MTCLYNGKLTKAISDIDDRAAPGLEVVMVAGAVRDPMSKSNSAPTYDLAPSQALVVWTNVMAGRQYGARHATVIPKRVVIEAAREDV